jgi:quinol monooxygenase YgiN
MIHVIATIELKPGTREAFLAEFYKLVPHVIAEVGCIEYGPTIDVASGIAAQKPIREEVVIVIEKWASLDHLKTHLSAPHMTPYREAVKEMVIATRLEILEPA